MAEQIGKKLKEVNDAPFKSYNQLKSLGFTDPSETVKTPNEPSGFEKFTGTELDFDPSDYYRLLGTGIDPRGELEERASQAQSVGEKLGKGLARVGTKIAIEAGKLPGELVGLTEWAVTGFDTSKFAESVNNTWVQTLSDFESDINNDALKVYIPESVKTGNLWDNITSSSFWATEGADGIGFLLSMMIPGQFLKAAKVGEGGAGLAKTLKLIKPGDVNVAKWAGKIDDVAAASVNTLFESASEGIDTANQIKEAFYKKRYDELMNTGRYDPQEAADLATEYMNSEQVKNEAGVGGFKVFRDNLGILIGPNILDQKWLFNGFKSAKAAESAIGKRMAAAAAKGELDALEGITKLTGKQITGKGLKEGLIGVGKEGFFEEGLQFSATEYEKNKIVDPENAENFLNTYIEGLSDTDMQKSIFLGGVLGGGMGMIGGINSAKREDAYLFGKTGTERGPVGKLLGLRDIEESRGVLNVFKDNNIARYKSVVDLLQREEDGSLKIDPETNKPVIDQDKLLRYGANILGDQVNKKQLDYFIKSNNKEGYEYVKAIRDLNFMYPYMQVEGGHKLLVDTINKLAERDLQEIKDSGLYEESTVSEVKQDLLNKANRLNEIYRSGEKNFVSLFNAKGNEKHAESFSHALFDQFVSTEFTKQYVQDRNNEYQQKINEFANKGTRTEKATISQLKKGSAVKVNGETQMIISKGNGNIKFRNLEGKLTDMSVEEFQKLEPEIIKGISIADRNQMFKDVEQYEFFRQKLDEVEEIQENLDSKKHQQEMFDEYVAAMDKLNKKGEEVANKKVKEKVETATTPETIETAINEQPDPKETTVLEDIVETKGSRERADSTKESTSNDYYDDKPDALVTDMRKLLGANAFDDGLILSKVDSIEFNAFKNDHDKLDDKDKPEHFKSILAQINDGTIVEDAGEAQQIKNVVDKYFEEANAKAQQILATEEQPVPEDEVDNSVDSLPNLNSQEIQDDKTLDPVREDRATGDVTAVSGDNTLIEIPTDNPNKQHWVLARDVNGDLIPYVFKYNSQELNNEYRKGRKLLNSGKIPVGTKIRFKVDKNSIYNKFPNRNINDFQIQIIAEYKGKDHVIGFVPAVYGEKNNNASEIRSLIWEEYVNKSGEFTSTYTSELTKLKSGKILRLSSYRTLSDTTHKDAILSAVVEVNGEKKFVVGSEIDPSVTGNVSANDQQSGAIHLWVQHPANGRWYPIRAFSRKVGELDDLKIEIINKLKTITNLQSAKDVLENIKEDDAVIDFRYDETTGVITPREKVAGVWTSKDGENGTEDLRFPLSEIDTNPSAQNWINSLTSRVNKEGINVGNYNERVASKRLSINFSDEIFGDVNFEFPKTGYGTKVSTPIKNKEEIQEQVVEETVVVKPIEEEIITPPSNPDIDEASKTIERDSRVIRKRNRPKASIVNEENYTKWDKEKEIEWFKERFPDVPITVLDNIARTFSYDKKLWGLFKNASVYIANNAKKGTTFHEAFHVVFNMYLSDEQQSDITKDLSEEQLAEHFADYINGIEDRTLGQKILDFFKGLWAYIKSIATGSLNEDLLFRRIQNNYFKGKSFVKDVSEFKTEEYVRFSEIPGWTRRQTVLEARSINNYLLNVVLEDIRSGNEAYKNLNDVQLLNAISTSKVNGVLVAYREVLKDLKASAEEFVDTEDELMYNELVKSMEFDINNNNLSSGSILSAAIIDLNNYGIKVTGKSLDYKNDEEAEDSNEIEDSLDELGQSETWQVHEGGVNTKNLISYRVKKYIRNLTALSNDGQALSDPIGLFDAPVNYDTFYDTIMKDVSSEETVSDMIDVLESLSLYHPEYKTVAADLRNDKGLATGFFQAFNKPELTQIFVSELFKGKGVVSDMILSYSNQKGVKSDIISKWVAGTESKGLDKNPRLAIQYQNKIKEFGKNNENEITAEASKEFAKILSEVGLYVPEEFLYNDFIQGTRTSSNDTISSFSALLGKFAELNPFGETGKETNIINSLTNKLVKTESSLTQPSFNNAKNQKVYAHQEGNYMVRLINKLKKNPDKAGEVLRGLLKDDIYRSALPLFNELLEKIEKPGSNPKLLLDNLEYAILDGTRFTNEGQGKMYPEMDVKTVNATLLSLYSNNGNETSGWFKLFTLSDAPVMPLVKYMRRNIERPTKGREKSLNITDSLVSIARAEVKRIQRIQGRLETLPKDQLIKNYDTKLNASFETGFKILPFLNGKIDENIDLTDSSTKDWDKVAKIITKSLEEEYNKYLADLVKQGILTEAYAPVSGLFPGQFSKVNKDVKEFVREFFYNDYFMRSQFTLMSIGDIAFYKSDNENNPVVDAQKRSKEVHSPRSYLDLTAEFDGYGIPNNYNGIILKDEEFYSKSGEPIYNALVKTGTSSKEAMKIASKYGYSNDTITNKDGKVTPIARVDKDTFFVTREVNQTDAQAYITLDFYRDTMIGAGKWDNEYQASYERLKESKGTSEDIKRIFQPFKPFAYGIRTITQTRLANRYNEDNYYVPNEDNPDEGVYMIDDIINVPTQHKNSEYVLIPQLIEKGDEKLKKLYNFMVDNKVSIANFESAGKAGNFGVTKAEDLGESTVVHNYSMSMRGIQQEVPEHFIDSKNLYGSQIRALIMANLKEGEDYIIKGNKEVIVSKKGKDLYELYNDLITANIEESYAKLAEDFGLNESDEKVRLEKIRDLLLSEIQDRNKGEQYEKAIQLVKSDNGKWRFALPLFHPIHSRVVENLINSVFKNRVTKQKINGGAFVQVSNFGFTDKLNLKFNEENGNLEYAEVMLPQWSEKLFKPYMKSDGTIDFQRLEQEAPDMLRGVGYRIPTEDKYSMLPFKVVGFLPLEEGGSIMLPAEITTIAGSDFDVDKMYVMLPEGVVTRRYKSSEEKSLEELFPEGLPEIEDITKQFSKQDLIEAEKQKKQCLTSKYGR